MWLTFLVHHVLTTIAAISFQVNLCSQVTLKSLRAHMKHTPFPSQQCQ